MPRGKLRVFLGAAPGVGKTYAMLEEGHRLAVEGLDVAVGLVETHGRPDTAALIDGLEVIPRRTVTYRGNTFEEMDLDAVLRRKPDIALIDELAHTNVPGSGHDKRWEDVEVLLAAGIDVITTLNIQHLESMNDVVTAITGVVQRETIPDEVVRRADEIEMVDLTQEGIRERMAAGKIYPAERIDAALANFFRPGNLGALRELALSWTADRVDEALERYRETHGIDASWETKERVVVAIAGLVGGDHVVRRAARMAMRARSELLGVHVRAQDGLAVGSQAADELASQRRLLTDLGGTYHEVVGDDVGEALVRFARAENATQLVMGASRRTRWEELLRGSPILEVVRRSGPIDVHVISHPGLPGRRLATPNLPRSRLPRRRRIAGWALAVIIPVLATAALLPFSEQTGLDTELLVLLLVTVAVAAVGGILPALVASVIAFLLANWFFTEPTGTFTIAEPANLFTLIVFLIVAGAVGGLVGLASRRAAEASRARREAEALATLAGSITLDRDALEDLVHQIRATFELEAAAVLRPTDTGWEVVASAGEPVPATPELASEVLELASGTRLALLGSRLGADDWHVLHVFTAQLAAVLETRKLQVEAAAAQSMAETDRLRTALLTAVSHDLRTPLAGIKASVTSLLETNVDWSEEEVDDFLEAILSETERLNNMVGKLLDASRIQTGAVHVFFQVVGLDEVVTSAIAGRPEVASRLVIDVPESLPSVQTDPALLERVVANLVENAVSWSPEGEPVRVTGGEVAGRVDLRISDRGPGIPESDRDRVFQPFQRLGDSPDGAGVGLGLAVAQGLVEAMGHELIVEDTPGGGTTMVVGIKAAL